MKLLALLLFVLLPLAAHAGNLLANGTFADGKAHWKGDTSRSNGDAADASPLDNPTGNMGMVVTLNPKECTRISQVFRTSDTAVTLTATYQLSAGFKTLTWEDAYMGTSYRPSASTGTASPLTRMISSAIDIDVAGFFQGPDHAFVVVVVDPTQNSVCYSTFSPANTANSQTSTTVVKDLMAHEEKTFYLIFPPGKGTVTLQKLELVPGLPRKNANPGSPSGILNDVSNPN